VWRAVRRAAEALWALQEEQSRMRDAWRQANQATVSDFGPLTWGLTLDLPGGQNIVRSRA